MKEILRSVFTLFFRQPYFPVCGFVFFVSCTGNSSVSQIKNESPDSLIVTHSKRLFISRHYGYSIIRITDPWQGASGVVQNWYLARDGVVLPPDASPEQVIRVPVKNVICTSTTHLAMISVLGETGSVIGFSGTRYIYSEEFRRMVTEEKIHEIGYDENLNKELILRLEPDVVIVYGVGSEASGYINKLKDLGIKVLYDADYLETDPLGKAEWLKLFGELYLKENIADSIFSDIATEYTRLKTFVNKNTHDRPSVLLGLPFKDTWFVSPGNSYISELISDAGGTYLWQDTESSVSMPMGLENVFVKALKADYWLNPGIAASIGQICSVDARFAGLPCCKPGRIFNNIKLTNEMGGNDYWETGTVSPQILLEDIATILHPGLFPGRDLVFFSKLN